MTTTNDEPVIETPAADAPEAKKPRTKPRKLSTTDKLLELHGSAKAKEARLHARADRLRAELAAVVKELNEARSEAARLEATLPQRDDVTTSQRRNVTNGHAADAEGFEVDPA